MLNEKERERAITTTVKARWNITFAIFFAKLLTFIFI